MKICDRCKKETSRLTELPSKAEVCPACWTERNVMTDRLSVEIHQAMRTAMDKAETEWFANPTPHMETDTMKMPANEIGLAWIAKFKERFMALFRQPSKEGEE